MTRQPFRHRSCVKIGGTEACSCSCYEQWLSRRGVYANRFLRRKARAFQRRAGAS